MKRNTALAIVVLVIVIGVGAYLAARGNDQQPIVTSADNAPPGTIHNLPVPQAVAAVRTKVAAEQGVPEGEVIVLTAFEKQWPDSCLGLPNPGELCAQVITPGYEVTVQAKGQGFAYRANEQGTEIREEK